MKKLSISLIVILLACQYSFAACPCEDVIQRLENPQELTQEEAKEILFGLINCLGTEEINEQLCATGIAAIGTGMRICELYRGLGTLIIGFGILLMLFYC